MKNGDLTFKGEKLLFKLDQASPTSGRIYESKLFIEAMDKAIKKTNSNPFGLLIVNKIYRKKTPKIKMQDTIGIVNDYNVLEDGTVLLDICIYKDRIKEFNDLYDENTAFSPFSIGNIRHDKDSKIVDVLAIHHIHLVKMI